VVARSFERTVHRLIHRCDRLDSVTTPGSVHTRLRRAATAGNEDSTMAAAAMPLPGAVPVRRVLRRSAPDTIEPGPATARRTDGDEVVVEASRRIAGPSREADPPLDVERITDQVVKAIDRRLVAHRERMGQT
jgi:hypothetical protein